MKNLLKDICPKVDGAGVSKKVFPAKLHKIVLAGGDIRASLLTALTAFGSALGNARKVDWLTNRGQRVGGNLFLMNYSGETSDKAKSLTNYWFFPLERARDVLAAHDPENEGEYDKKVHEWDHDIIPCIGGQNENGKKLVVRDMPSGEFLPNLAVNPHGLAYIADDGQKWLKNIKKGIFKGCATSYRQKFKEGWEYSTSFISLLDRHGDPKSMCIWEPAISLVVNLDERNCIKFFNGDNIESGFAHRFIYNPISSDENKIQYPMGKGNAKYLENVMLKLTELDYGFANKEKPFDFQANEEARNCYIEWYRRMTGCLSHGFLTPFCARIDEMFFRFCLIIHCLNWACDAVESGTTPEPETELVLWEIESAILVTTLCFQTLGETIESLES